VDSLPELTVNIDIKKALRIAEFLFGNDWTPENRLSAKNEFIPL